MRHRTADLDVWTMSEPCDSLHSVRLFAVVAALLMAASCSDAMTSDPGDSSSRPTSAVEAETQSAVDGPVMRYPTLPISGDGMEALVLPVQGLG